MHRNFDDTSCFSRLRLQPVALILRHYALLLQVRAARPVPPPAASRPHRPLPARRTSLFDRLHGFPGRFPHA